MKKEEVEEKLDELETSIERSQQIITEAIVSSTGRSIVHLEAEISMLKQAKVIKRKMKDSVHIMNTLGKNSYRETLHHNVLAEEIEDSNEENKVKDEKLKDLLKINERREKLLNHRKELLKNMIKYREISSTGIIINTSELKNTKDREYIVSELVEMKKDTTGVAAIMSVAGTGTIKYSKWNKHDSIRLTQGLIYKRMTIIKRERRDVNTNKEEIQKNRPKWALRREKGVSALKTTLFGTAVASKWGLNQWKKHEPIKKISSFLKESFHWATGELFKYKKYFYKKILHLSASFSITENNLDLNKIFFIQSNDNPLDFK